MLTSIKKEVVNIGTLIDSVKYNISITNIPQKSQMKKSEVGNSNIKEPNIKNTIKLRVPYIIIHENNNIKWL